jgi:hypothetical protein
LQEFCRNYVGNWRICDFAASFGKVLSWRDRGGRDNGSDYTAMERSTSQSGGRTKPLARQWRLWQAVRLLIDRGSL